MKSNDQRESLVVRKLIRGYLHVEYAALPWNPGNNLLGASGEYCYLVIASAFSVDIILLADRLTHDS